MKNIILKISKIGAVALLLFMLQSFSPHWGKANIQTSGNCDMCKTRIENALNKIEGVRVAYFNLANAKVKVKYDSEKVSVEQLRNAISAAGYDADNVKANQQAHDSLPTCCQKGNVCTH